MPEFFPPVRTKRDFVKRYSEGEFGNASPTWDTLQEFKDHCKAVGGRRKDALYHIRNRVAGGPTYYNLSSVQVVRDWMRLTVSGGGVDPKSLYISEMCPTERTTIQGEVQLGPQGLDLFYSRIAKPMREALATRADRVQGIIANSLLRHFMCANSYDWLQVLLDRYPGHVVEFSTFSVNWGTLPRFNSVYWEVRSY